MYRLFTKLYARRIAEQFYRGVLGRTGDSAGIQNLSREIARHGRLDKVLADMAGSTEAWEKGLRARPQDLARLAYGAVAGREPTPDEEAAAAERLGGGPQGLAALLTELAGGRRREGWQPAEAEGLVRAVFAGLLAREPDEEALRAYTAFLVDSQNPAGLVGDVAGSAEHLQQVVAQQAPALVQLVFRALLEREADPEALAAYSARLAETRDLQALVAEVGASREHRNLLLRRLAAGAAA